MQANEYLDAAKVALQVESDYQLAKKIEARKQEICAIRKGDRPLNSYIAARVSDVTGIPLEKVIADVEANDKNEQRAAYWRERAARKVAGFFVAVLSAGSLGVMPNDVEAASETYKVSQHVESRINTGLRGWLSRLNTDYAHNCSG